MNSLRNLLTLLFAATVSASPAVGQGEDPIPDTLDWHGYMPLNPGNLWQYSIEIYDAVGYPAARLYEQWFIRSDTTIDGSTYVVLEKTCDFAHASPDLYAHLCDPQAVERSFIRYDEAGANLSEWIRSEPDAPREQPWLHYEFRLDAPFHSQGASDYGEFYYSRAERDWVVLSRDTVHTTVKHVEVFSAGPGAYTFAHGLGLIGSAFFEGGGAARELNYARIDGHTYGLALPLAATVPVQIRDAGTLDVYPNPSQGSFTVLYETALPGKARLVLMDVLGRESARYDLGYRVPGRYRDDIGGAGLSSGTYLILLSLDDRVAARQAFVVVR